MIALGLDPGTHRIGYGVVRQERGVISLVTAGLIAVSPGPQNDMLVAIKAGLDRLCVEYAPNVVAVERLFFAKNRKTALRVAEARGVLLLAVSERGLSLREFTPNEVKAGIAGYGGADKRAVLKMVRLILREPELVVVDDASDALALAILAAQAPIGARAGEKPL
jgi:crossover junction endodeoxyribonuclease RuvC